MHPTVRNVVLFGQRFRISDLFGNGLYAGFDFTDLERTKVWGPSSLPLLWSAPTQGSAISASAQTVGIALDKSQGVPVGAEMAGNDIGAAPWDAPTGGSVAAGAWSGMANNDYIPLSNALTVGAYYRLTWSNLVGGGTFYWGTIISTAASSGSIVFRAAGVLFSLYASVAGSITVSSVSLKPISGNHALQATSGSRPAYTETGSGRMLTADGGDDGMTTPLLPGPAMTMFAAVTPVSGAAGTDIVIGAAEAGPTNRCQLALVDGVVSGGWGSHSVSTIKDAGATDIRNVNSVLVLRADASLVELGRMAADGSFSWLYQQPPSGTATTAQGLAILANNAAGSLGSFYEGRATALAVKRKAPDAMILPTMRQMATLAFG